MGLGSYRHSVVSVEWQTKKGQTVSALLELVYRNEKRAECRRGLFLDAVGEVAGVAETGDDIGVGIDFGVDGSDP